MASRIDPMLQKHLNDLGSQLQRRARLEQTLSNYYDGMSPLPLLIIQAKITNAYRMLMGMATAPWASVVVDAVQDKLEVTGLQSGDQTTDQTMWDWWQDQQLDAESKLVHQSALIGGRAYGMVWPDDDGVPQVSFDSMSQMIVKYQEGSRRNRMMALRYWYDEDDRVPCATLYTPDYIWKFEGPQDVQGPDGVDWMPRFVDGEDYPLENPYGIIPVVEFGINRRLKAGTYPFARGEFQQVTALIDRINTLTFLGLICAYWMGFPIRAVIGDSIRRDDNKELLPPFEVMSDEVVQFENPAVKLDQFDPADRSNLSIYYELGQLASLTRTPITFFPGGEGTIANLSADAIRAVEGGLVSKMPKHKAALGESWEELIRTAGLMMDPPIILDQGAELQWTDHVPSSLAERADAASKLATVLPQQALLEYVLNLTSEQMQRMQVQQASDTMAQLLKSAATPAPAPAAIQPMPGEPNEAPMPGPPEQRPGPMANG